MVKERHDGLPFDAVPWFLAGMENGHSAERPRRVTIYDIAAATGFAASTVSRALSRPERVSATTRERIASAARELSYVPNSPTPDLKRTKTVAILVSDVTNPFYFGLIRGIQHQLKAVGYASLLIDSENSSEIESAMLHRVRQSVDGAIFAASRLTGVRLAELGAELPLVVINRRVHGVPSVVIDSPSGVVQAAEHLISLGHREIVYVSGPQNSWANEARWRSLAQACATHRVPVRRLGPFPAGPKSGSAAADALIRTRATACIAFNDLLAIGMLTHLRTRGIAVPAAISIVGCDDIFGADFCHPALTTLSAPIEQAGRAAVTMLMAHLTHDVPATRSTTVLPAHLVVRESTGPAPRRRPAAGR
ncbi:LacI family DNA-binding transcriptional regulator [Streptomyces sp. H39-S7]|uniref:LacI family DNA-binding transcriptional regulator n=1 Tax=Streptomyces sp. H39-S7 TaxID=3004357 RepID=UPI0022B01F26|nr:LacI family DNA-binding transcriptional regulator [Streptomyces sp. H39-S7]MCZ4125520.1 LacI family DNA-binding transcriptional regulator [Streptomyces sp. H39-S7]